MPVACPACHGTGTRSFYTRTGVPAHSCLLLDTALAATRFPTGDLRLTLCEGCGFVFNAAFDETLTAYSPDYEETQGYSPHFQAFIDDLAGTWVDRYALQGKKVVEIGCGKGEFLAALARHGVAEVVGIDPGVHPERIPDDVRDRVRVVRGLFPQDMPVIDADAVVCRHTLEHVPAVRQFLEDVRTATVERPDAVMLFELPESLRVFDEAAFWDVYYEHCSYFSEQSLTRLFRATGWHVADVRTVYDGQYIVLEASRPTSPGASDDAEPRDLDGSQMRAAIETFSAAERSLVERWTEAVTKPEAGHVALWGSGSKGVAFLAALGRAADEIDAIVDINPNKWDRYMAGSGHRIVPPRQLRELKPDLVVVMNPVYVPEIRTHLYELGLTPHVRHL